MTTLLCILTLLCSFGVREYATSWVESATAEFPLTQAWTYPDDPKSPVHFEFTPRLSPDADIDWLVEDPAREMAVVVNARFFHCPAMHTCFPVGKISGSGPNAMLYIEGDWRGKHEMHFPVATVKWDDTMTLACAEPGGVVRVKTTPRIIPVREATGRVRSVSVTPIPMSALPRVQKASSRKLLLAAWCEEGQHCPLPTSAWRHGTGKRYAEVFAEIVLSAP